MSDASLTPEWPVAVSLAEQVWPCDAPRCDAVRAWAGGRAGFNLPACEHCGSALVKSGAERADVRELINKHLI